MANFWVLVSDHIGDNIFCTPAMELLKRRRAQNEIIIVAPSESVAEIWVNNPAISQVWVEPTWSEISEIMTKEDLVIDMHDNRFTKYYVKQLKRSTLVSPRIGQDHQSKIALDFIDSHFPGSSTLNSPQYRLYPGDDHFVLASRLLSVIPKNTTHVLGFHLGSSQIRAQSWWGFGKANNASKCWPVESFIALAKAIEIEWPHTQIVITGTTDERPLLERFLAEYPRAIDLIDKTSVLTLAAVMKRISVFITGDTGPLHVACAMNTPVIALFGSDTTPEQTGPYPAAADRLCVVGYPISEIRTPDVLMQLRTLIQQESHNDSKHDSLCEANG